MLTTSVNESGNVPLNEYEDIKKEYNDKVDYIYDTNIHSSNISSTVLLMVGNELKILREGEVSLEEINLCLNNIK